MISFIPNGNTVNIDVSAASQAVLIGNLPAASGDTIRIQNNGTATVWVNFGPSTVTASLTTSMPVPAGAIEVMTLPHNSTNIVYAAVIAAGATGKIYFTPGSGI